MVKLFFVQPGYFAHSGGLWYEPGILLVVEKLEHVAIFANREGMPGNRVGRYDFAQLNEHAPPPGLLCADDPNDLRLHLRSGPRVAA